MIEACLVTHCLELFWNTAGELRLGELYPLSLLFKAEDMPVITPRSIFPLVLPALNFLDQSAC